MFNVLNTMDWYSVRRLGRPHLRFEVLDFVKSDKIRSLSVFLRYSWRAVLLALSAAVRGNFYVGVWVLVPGTSASM